MATTFRCLFILVHFLQIIKYSVGQSENFPEKFTTRCDEICGKNAINRTENAVPECHRGCLYFNIEFLTNVRNVRKSNNLNLLLKQCAQTCTDAYPKNGVQKSKCDNGCAEMMSIQSKAPYVNGWLVYMGASDRSMVLLQPDLDIASKDDWVLLDSVLRTSDYDYDQNTYERLFEDQHYIQSVPIYAGHQQFTINHCVPSWIWMIPLLLLVVFIWVHYSNYIYSVFIRESLEHEFRPRIRDRKLPTEDFVVGTDFYFYPSPAIPPPKYHEAAEAVLLSSGDEDDSNCKKNEQLTDCCDGNSKNRE